jgi:hypothetical protein
MDRDAARRDERVLGEAVHEIHRFFDNVGDRLPLFDPFEPMRAAGIDNELTNDIGAALADRDWIEGYRLGRDDARREALGAPLRGPGATANPKDGWSPSRTRLEAYRLGRVDGTDA